MPEKLVKDIPLNHLMDLKIDYAFKQLFGTEENKKLTIVFLNAVLKRTGQDLITDLSFTNTEAGGTYVDDKQSRLDVLAITNTNTCMNIEIQFTNQYDMIKRSIYYWAGVYRAPLQRKMSYKELNPVIAINILNFNLFNQTDDFHTTYHLYEDERRFKLTDVKAFHFIEMPKLIKKWQNAQLDPWNDVLTRWLLLLAIVDRKRGEVHHDIYKKMEGIAMKDETLHDAFKKWEEISMTQEEIFAYEARLKKVFDEQSAKREAMLRLEEAKSKAIKEGLEKGLEKGLEEGLEQGLAAGRKEGIEEGIEDGKKAGIEEGLQEGLQKGLQHTEEKMQAVARHLLEKGVDINTISEATGLDKQSILNLQD